MKYKAVIKGKGGNKINKIIKYLTFYFQIIFNFFLKYDFIYVHFPIVASPLLIILMKIKKQNVLLNFHGEDLLYNSIGIYQILGEINDRFCRKYANYIIVPSNYYKKKAIERRIIDEDKIIVSPSGGVDKKLFYPKTLECKEKNIIHLGFIGRLEENKGIWEFISAVKELSKIMPCRATIVGYGSLYKNIKKEISLYSSIFTIKDGVVQCELMPIYNTFDLFVFPSKRKCESLGLVGLEAMACGIPVIGSNIGGIATYLEDQKNGYLINLDDCINEIINSVFKFIRLSDEERNKMKLNCLKTAELYFRDNVIEELSRKIYTLNF